jgi:hypothetical protein
LLLLLLEFLKPQEPPMQLLQSRGVVAGSFVQACALQ